MRRCKVGLDYFPVDVDFFNDEKIEIVSAKHGLLAELITLKLLSRIYRQGYFIEWDEDTAYLYSKKFGDLVTYELLDAVILELVERSFFNADLFKKYNILTSRGIQRRYLEASKRRKNVEITKEFLLLSIEDVNIINQNVNILSLNADISTQRKEKKRKEKKTPPTPPTKKERAKAFLPQVEKLSSIVQSVKQIKHTPQQKAAWCLELCRLHEDNGVSVERMENALDWYVDHIGEKYVPVIESGTSFKEKFTNLEAAIKRNGGLKNLDEWAMP